MNSNSLIGYMGLINKNYSTSIDADDIICYSITAQHYYNIGCETLNTSFVNPELTLSFDPTNNMFTLHLYDSSIPLSRLVVGMYDSLAVPETLVFRDATNSTTLNTLIVSGLLTATANANSVVSNANLINLTNSITNQYNPIVFITSSLVNGYKDLHYDNLNHLSINPVTNTLRITGGNLQLNNSSLSISDATGAITYGLLYSGGINLYGTAKYMIGGIQLKTNDIPESVGGNLYYTDARSRLSITLSSLGSEIGAIYNSASGIITIPSITTNSIDVTKILKGLAGQFLRTSSSLVNNWETVDTDDIQESITPVNKYFTDARSRLSITLSSLGSEIAGAYNSATGIIVIPAITNGSINLTKIALSAYSELALAFTLACRDINGDLQSRVSISNAINLIGGLGVRGIYSFINTTFPSIAPVQVNLHQQKYASLNGISTGASSIAPLWDRVSAVNNLEIIIYSNSTRPTFKIEGQLCNYFNTPNTQLLLNVGVFINANSLSIANTTDMVSSTFINRSLLGGNTTYQTPYIVYWSDPNLLSIAGTCYTFTLYTSNSAGTRCVGRSANDIPSNMFVTQIL